jgi:hypothetical protein
MHDIYNIKLENFYLASLLREGLHSAALAQPRQPIAFDAAAAACSGQKNLLHSWNPKTLHEHAQKIFAFW